MHPSYGVPWPRLQRAAARLIELHATAEHGRVHALLFLCGLKYLLTYRELCGRRLTHYLDDGLREAVEDTLPALMKHGGKFQFPHSLSVPRPRFEANIEFHRLTFAFASLLQHLPATTVKWAEQGRGDTNIVRLSFGMGVAARFAPESHLFVRGMLAKPLVLSPTVLDVLESFRWHSEWSLALAS